MWERERLCVCEREAQSYLVARTAAGAVCKAVDQPPTHPHI